MTKIPSTQELIKLVYSPDVSFDDMLEAAIDIHRTALLTELLEWVEIKKLDTTVMNVANRKRAGHINRTLIEIQAHINNLINPSV